MLMIGKETVRKVAQVARLSLTEKEISDFSGDMKSIISAFEKLSAVDTEKTKPSFQPVEIKNITRKDVVEESLPHEEAMANTKNREEGHFRGPKVV